MWFVKTKRAQTSEDDETWVAGGVVPTLNGFDCGDTRTTVVILMREREGKSGGGKGFLLTSEKAFTLATSNFHTVFLFEATRVEDVRIYKSYSPTVATYWGTGGARVPYVYAIQGTVIGRNDKAGPQGKGFGEDGDPMFTLDCVSGHGVAYPLDLRNATRDADKLDAQNRQGLGVGNEGDPSPTITNAFVPGVAAVDFYNNSLSEKNQSLRSAASDASKYGGIMQGSTVRRLTPTECERLQGFPDGWTDGQADSHRYKQMGNAVAVPVVSWIIERMTK